MKFKLIAFDLDGTLLNNEKLIDRETIDYLAGLKKRNIDIVIATGRSYYDAKRLTQSLPFEYVIIANNGAVTRIPTKDHTLDLRTIRYDDFQKIIRLSKENDLHPIIYVDKNSQGYDIIIEREFDFSEYNGYLSKSLKRYRITDFSDYLENDVLSICFTGHFEPLENFRQQVLSQYPMRFSTSVSLKLHVEALMEILHPDACKWKALKRYCDYKGIGKEEILAFGDDNNDVEMIKNAGMGIVMVNGTDMLKSVGRATTRYTNDEKGVYLELVTIFGELNDNHI
ncbi:MAG TPA: Cof-type HAD-IIB family hydrolase [Clostridiales bacterium]|nr:Cof-type HAD-IIB family hydrolase [Clostridiales bacterium]